MAKNKNNIVDSDLKESLIMRPVRIQIPMPPGAAVPVQPPPQAPAAAVVQRNRQSASKPGKDTAQGRDSLIMRPVKVQIPMDPQALVQSQAHATPKRPKQIVKSLG
jgi:hypothetical protein